MTKIRTRFAPSPTGRMHVGNLRTALYAYLIAKHEGGDFILRIEDTDQERYVEGAVDIIYRTLEKTGLLHDEGPDKDGGAGHCGQGKDEGSQNRAQQPQGSFSLWFSGFFHSNTVPPFGPDYRTGL